MLVKSLIRAEFAGLAINNTNINIAQNFWLEKTFNIIFPNPYHQVPSLSIVSLAEPTSPFSESVIVRVKV